MAPTGFFVWYDLFTPDKQASIDFYTAVTGWTMTTWDDGGYQMWTPATGDAIGGLEEAAEGSPRWLGYVTVPDVDAAIERATSMGGAVFKPAYDVPNVGRMAEISDPAGAILGIFTSANEWEPTQPASPNGQIGWAELASSDPEKGVRFWFRLFGWTDVDTMQSPQGKYMMYGRSRKEPALGGMYAAQPGNDSAWLFYITVPDLDASLAKAKLLGAQVVFGPMKVPSGDRVASCRDPQGAAFALHEVGGEANSAPTAK